MTSNNFVFFDRIQFALDQIENVSYQRVDENIIWVGASDIELNRTLDLTFEHSLRIHIGKTINYYEREKAIEKEVCSLFMHILNNQIVETQYLKDEKLLKTEYYTTILSKTVHLGIVGKLSELFYSASAKKQIIHPRLLKDGMFESLNKELDDIYS